MATFLDCASDSITEIGQAGIGQSISPEMAAQALRVANRMLAKWATKRLYLPTPLSIQLNLTAATQDYTIGQTAPVTFNQPRPVFVESARAVLPNSLVENPLNILDNPSWAAIRDKGAMTSLNGAPSDLWPEYTMPNLAFHVWPIPQMAVVIKMGIWQPIQQFVTIFDNLNLAPGYEEALQHNLALELCQFYDVSPAQVQITAQLAADSLLAISGVNAQSIGGVVGESRTLASPNLDKPVQAGPQGNPPQSTT